MLNTTLERKYRGLDQNLQICNIGS